MTMPVRPRVAAIDPTDRYNLTLPNYLQIPQERWMVNAFTHYDLLPRVTAYAEMHFSTNSVTSRLSPSNVNATMLFNNSNPYATPAIQNLFTALDNAEPLPNGVSSTAGRQDLQDDARRWYRLHECGPPLHRCRFPYFQRTA